MKNTNTKRGFNISEFTDSNGNKCSLQNSSSAMEAKIWLGTNDADAKIMAKEALKHGIKTTEEVGWIKFPIPSEVLLNTRMHLNRSQVKELLPYLTRFAETGSIQ